MKVMIAAKEFNGLQIGAILGITKDVPNNHLVNDGSIVVVDIPNGVDSNFIQVSYETIPEYWTKSGQANLSVQPTIEVNQPIIENDDSWTYNPAQAAQPDRWNKAGFATQFDPPPMLIVDGEEVEDTSWTFLPATAVAPEYWSKDGEENELTQPTISVDNFVTISDPEWTYNAAVTTWVVSEDAVKKAEDARVSRVQKYEKRIKYADTLIAEIAERNESKNLTVPQIVEMNQVYAPIMGLLNSGSYGSAYTAISSATPSAGITSEDISYIVGLIEAYLTNEAANG